MGHVHEVRAETRASEPNVKNCKTYRTFKTFFVLLEVKRNWACFLRGFGVLVKDNINKTITLK